jgi:microcystin-dependent protein
VPVTLTRPTEGSVGWAGAVNQNFQDIETAINSGGAGGVVATEVGGILLWHSATPPTGWLLCDGTAVSRTTYADLFGVVGTAWGAGDGSTTFNLPNFTGRSPMGVDTGGTGQITTAVSQAKGESTHTMTSGELVAHSHGVTDPSHSHVANRFGTAGGSNLVFTTGSISTTTIPGIPSSGPVGTSATGISINNAGSSTPFNVVHPVRGTYFVIRYQATTTAPSVSVFADNLFRVRDDGDTTKQVALDVSGVTTATTRTLTVPNSNGTIALTSQLPAGAALTKVDDTNVTLTLGGTPSTALLQAASVTAGWTGQLAPGRGGTGLASYTAGDLLYASGAAAISKLGIGAANQLLRTNAGATAPEWATLSTLLDTIGSTRGSLLYRGVSGWAAVTPGTSGHVLTSNGAGSDPTYQASAGGGSGASFARLSATATPTTLTTGDSGRVVMNHYPTAGLEVDLPTGLGTATTDALMYSFFGRTPAGAATQDQTTIDPGANGYFTIPGLHSGPVKLTAMDDESNMILWGTRDPTNTIDLWTALSLVGRWVNKSTQPFVFGNDPNVNPAHGFGGFSTRASGVSSTSQVEYGDMSSLTLNDPGGSSDQALDLHGLVTVFSGTNAGLYEVPSSSSTLVPKFGQCHRTYIKFLIAGVPASQTSYIGWGTATPTSQPFAGLRFTSNGSNLLNAADIYYRG